MTKDLIKLLITEYQSYVTQDTVEKEECRIEIVPLWKWLLEY